MRVTDRDRAEEQRDRGLQAAVAGADGQPRAQPGAGDDADGEEQREPPVDVAERARG